MIEEKIKKIQDLALKHDIKAYEIGKRTSISIGTATNILKNKAKNPKEKTLNTIIDYLLSFENKNYPEEDWHTENMVEKGAAVREPEIKYSGVPYFDVDFSAGKGMVSFNQQSIPNSYITHPFFKGCDFVVRNSGHSMAKIIKHGDAMGLKQVHNWQEFLAFGEVYAIVLNDERRLTKIITKGETKEYFTIISKPSDKKKDEFPPQQLKKSLILAIFKVEASSCQF